MTGLVTSIFRITEQWWIPKIPGIWYKPSAGFSSRISTSELWSEGQRVCISNKAQDNNVISVPGRAFLESVS